MTSAGGARGPVGETPRSSFNDCSATIARPSTRRVTMILTLNKRKTTLQNVRLTKPGASVSRSELSPVPVAGRRRRRGTGHEAEKTLRPRLGALLPRSLLAVLKSIFPTLRSTSQSRSYFHLRRPPRRPQPPTRPLPPRLATVTQATAHALSF